MNSNTRQNAAATESNQPVQCKRKPTQKQQVLKHLQDYSRGLTSAEAARHYNCWRLAHWIYVLRNEGFNILTLDEPNEHRAGTHARYVLIPEPTPHAAA